MSEHLPPKPTDAATVYYGDAPLGAGSTSVPPAEEKTLHSSEVYPRVTPLDDPTEPSLPTTSEAPCVAQVGDYEILGELGRGGMGVVYKARHGKLKRLAALKMILSGGHASAEDLGRFRFEAEAVARLQHTNIVQIYEVDEQDGRPYLALEFVDGGSLASKLDGTPQPAEAAAGLVQTLARAMHFAHQHSVIHRDLKPANILLQRKSEKEVSDSVPNTGFQVSDFEPKVTDFGLAKQLGGEGGQTQSGEIMGTPSYMAPEQASGKTREAGPATDVYALGAILYELLTGRPPFRAPLPLDTIMQVVRQDPVPPSRLQPMVPRDLETICLKCLQKDPRKRYASAEALADDLQRFQNRESILARPASLWERTMKWVLRNPVPAALAGMTILAGLLIAAAVIVEQARLRRALEIAEQERDRANQQRLLADQRQVRLIVATGVQLVENGDLLASLPWFTEALRLEEEDHGRRQMPRLRLAVVLRDCPRPVQVWLHKGGVIWDSEYSSDGRYVATAGEDQSAQVWDAHTGQPVGPPLEHDDAVRQAVFSPSPSGSMPRYVATVSGRSVRLWDAATGRQLLPILEHKGKVHSVDFNSDGSRVLTAGSDNKAQVWETATRRPVGPALEHKAAVLKAAFSPDGAKILTAGADGVAQVWDAATGLKLGEPCAHKGEVYSAIFSPNGRYLVTASEDDSARIWDAATGKPLSEPLRHNSRVNCATFSPDGGLVATCSDDNTVLFWEAPTGRPQGRMLRHGSNVYQVRFSPDGKRVVTASDDNTARVWNALTGEPISAPLRHNGTVRKAVFSPDGKLLLTASEDGLARIWAFQPMLEGAPLLQHEGRVTQAAFSPDGHLVLTASDDRKARLWDAVTGKAIGSPWRHKGSLSRAVFSPDGQMVMTASADGTACIWRANTGEMVCPPLVHGSEVLDCAFSPDGQRVVTACVDGTAHVWETNTGEVIATHSTHKEAVLRVAFDPDGKRILSASSDRTAHVWDAATGESLLPPLKHSRLVQDASFSPDGRRIVTASYDQTARLWDAATGQELTPPLKHGSKVYHASFSPDGLWVATASDDNTARVWNALTGASRTPPLRHMGSVYRAVFSPDGRCLLTASDENVARLWDSATGELLAPPLRHRSGVQDVGFSPDGRRMVTGGADRVARIWELPPEDRPVEDLLAVTQLLAGGEIDAGGCFVPLQAGALHHIWETLRTKYPRAFSSSGLEDDKVTR
jgi:eukaryotic-like serine/threonine-protein kinase